MSNHIAAHTILTDGKRVCARYSRIMATFEGDLKEGLWSQTLNQNNYADKYPPLHSISR